MTCTLKIQLDDAEGFSKTFTSESQSQLYEMYVAFCQGGVEISHQSGNGFDWYPPSRIFSITLTSDTPSEPILPWYKSD